MKLPKSFIPKKNLDKETQRLLETEPKRYNSSNSATLFRNFSFENLKELEYLEYKIYHLEVEFRYKDSDYKLVYKPKGKKSLIQMVQKTDKKDITEFTMLDALGQRILMYVDFKASAKRLSEVKPNNKDITVDFYLYEELLKPISVLRNSFERKIPATMPGYVRDEFENINVHVIYHRLTMDELTHINSIHKERLKTSLTIR